jgi:aminoglycoside phosphotransferase (APT) family kinase protein
MTRDCSRHFGDGLVEAPSGLSTVRLVGDEEVLHGGVANAGAVLRAGSHVLRPSNEHSGSILEFLSRLEAVGFDAAPSPVGLEPDGRECLRFIQGDVAIPPYPEWAQSDEALASVATVIRELHDASLLIDRSDLTWSSEMADPLGGPVICHNDVCLENVVFGDGCAVALLDFDFAAPGRRTFDLAAFARMCVPVDDEHNSARLGWDAADRPGRLRIVCDTYGIDAGGRLEVLNSLSDAIASGGEFVRRHAEAGEPGFVRMWNEMGGMERFDRRRRWWAERRPDFAAALR